MLIVYIFNILRSTLLVSAHKSSPDRFRVARTGPRAPEAAGCGRLEVWRTEGGLGHFGRVGGLGLPGVAGVELGEVVVWDVGEGVLVHLVAEARVAGGGARARLGSVHARVAEDALDACLVEDGGHEAHAATAVLAG